MDEVLANEAIRILGPGIEGAARYGLQRLWNLVRGRSTRPPSDSAGLIAHVAQRARDDAAFFTDLAQEVVAIESAGALSAVAPMLFVDRDEVRAQVARPGFWLIAGPYRIGKTTLVQQVAYDLRDQVNGYANVDLDRYRSGAALRVVEVQQEVLRQLGVPQIEEPTPPVVAEQYQHGLTFRRFVLVLDNVSGAKEATDLVHNWPNAVVLVTTRMLGQDMRAWSPSPPITLGGLDPEGARQLLINRCGEQLVADEPDAVVELIRICDALPDVLVQVAAGLSRRRGEPGVVAAMVGRLASEPDSVAVLEASERRSVAELTPRAAAGLALLAHHPGLDISYPGAAAYLGGSGEAVIDELLDAALVFAEPDARLRMVWLARRRATTAGGDDESKAAAFDRYLRWFRDLAGAADRDMDAPGVTDADRARDGRLRRYPMPPAIPRPAAESRPVDRLQAEAHVVVDLLREAHHRGRHVEVVQVCGGLEALSTLRGHHWVCHAANEWGLASAKALGWTAAVVRLHTNQGRILTQLGLFDRADRELRAAEDLLPGLDDPQLESSVLEPRARWAQERQTDRAHRDLRAAESGMRRAVEIDRRIGDGRALAIHLRMLANILVEDGRAGEALALLGGVTAQAGDDRNAARLHLVRAKAHEALAETEAATAELRQARELTTRSAATQYEMELADVEARVALRTGDVDTARAWWSEIAFQYFQAGLRARAESYAAKLTTLPPPR